MTEGPVTQHNLFSTYEPIESRNTAPTSAATTKERTKRNGKTQGKDKAMATAKETTKAKGQVSQERQRICLLQMWHGHWDYQFRILLGRYV